MSIRVPRKNDAMTMADVLYKGLQPLRLGVRLLQMISVVLGLNVDPDIPVHTGPEDGEYYRDHLEEPHSVAFVTTDDRGTMSGMAFARFLNADTVPYPSRVTLPGCDEEELAKVGNRNFQRALIAKYGGILCEWRWNLTNRHRTDTGAGIGQMSVPPGFQGRGLGR
jgi:hypothetical protein